MLGQNKLMEHLPASSFSLQKMLLGRSTGKLRLPEKLKTYMSLLGKWGGSWRDAGRAPRLWCGSDLCEGEMWDGRKPLKVQCSSKDVWQSWWAKVTCQRTTQSPGQPCLPCLSPQSLVGSSLWEVRSLWEQGDGFQSTTPGFVRHVPPHCQESKRLMFTATTIVFP